MVCYKEIETLLRSLPNEVFLTQYGNEYAGNSLISDSVKCDVEDNARMFNLERINQAIEQIPKYFKMVRNVPRQVSSYGLKHILEQKLEEDEEQCSRAYITNGDFMVAMIFCGFTCKFRKINGKYLVNGSLNAVRK